MQINIRLAFLAVFSVLSIAHAEPTKDANLDQNSSRIFDLKVSQLNVSPSDITTYSSAFIVPKDSTFEEVISTSQNEVPSEKQISWPYSNDYHWIHFKMSNSDSMSSPLIMAFDSYLTGAVEFNIVQNQKLIEKKIGGSGTLSELREIKGLINGFKFIPPNGVFDIYLKIKSRHNFSNRILLGTVEQIKDLENLRKSIILIFVGALLFLIFYNLVIAVYLSDRSFYWYVFFNVIMLFITSILNGMIDYFPNIANWNYSEHLMVFSCLAAIVNLQFMRVYLDIDFANQKLVTFLKSIQILAGLVLLTHISPIESLTVGAKLGYAIDLIIGIEIVLMLAVPVYFSLQKNKMALFYLYGWLALGFSVLAFLLAHYNFIENTEFIRSSLLYGTGFQMLLLSLGLAYRFKILNTNLQTAEKKALSRDKYKRLTRILLHDLGNPLTIISAVGKNLESPNPKLSPEQSSIRIQRALGNISAILDHVRKGVISENDSAADDINAIPLEPILNECQFIFEETLKAKSIELDIQIEPDIHVMAERSSLLNDVINNIISNAIKFSNPGSKISIQDNHDSSWYILKIRDSGIGIPADTLNKIQSDIEVKSRKGTSGESGTGFGINLVRSYMKIYGGKVKIFSKVAGPDNIDSYTEVQLYFKTN